jgi:hypothetical protein
MIGGYHACALDALWPSLYIRFMFAYSEHMGQMRRAEAREEDARFRDRFASTLVIAAAIIAAVRLARDENISRPSPRLISVIGDSVGLARSILNRVLNL